MNSFLKTLSLTTAALFAASALLSAFWPALHLYSGWAGFFLMAANAFAAVAILRLRKYMEPVRLIVTSMLVRSLILVAIMLAAIQILSHGPALYSFIFSAMAGYVVYQAVEIRYLIRNPELLAS